MTAGISRPRECCEGPVRLLLPRSRSLCLFLIPHTSVLQAPFVGRPILRWLWPTWSPISTLLGAGCGAGFAFTLSIGVLHSVPADGRYQLKHPSTGAQHRACVLGREKNKIEGHCPSGCSSLGLIGDPPQGYNPPHTHTLSVYSSCAWAPAWSCGRPRCSLLWAPVGSFPCEPGAPRDGLGRRSLRRLCLVSCHRS